MDQQKVTPHEEGILTLEDQSRPAAYARVLARLPKYATRAMEVSRPLAYASEVGESFRKVFPKLVKPLYALSIGYVVGDIGIKSFNARHKNMEYRKWFLVDLSLWHLGASLILPAVVINRYVHGLARVLVKMNMSTKMATYLPTLSALCLIPFIVHPIDHFTDWAMDNSFRKYINYTQFDIGQPTCPDQHHYHQPDDASTKH